MVEYQRRQVFGSEKEPLKQKADGTIITETVVTMGAGLPILKLKSYSGSDETYQEVVSWTVGAGKTGCLSEMELTRDSNDKALFRITVNDILIITDYLPVAHWNKIFSPNEMAAGVVAAKIEVKSTDGTAIRVDAAISGDER